MLDRGDALFLPRVRVTECIGGVRGPVGRRRERRKKKRREAGLAAKIANLMVLGFPHCEQCIRDHDLNEFRKSVLNFIVSFEFQFDSFTAAPAN